MATELLGASHRPLPRALSSFIGRGEERAALGAAVAAHRLVTATGPGGVGKTRLALAVSDDVAGGSAGDVGLVDLVQVADAAMVVPAIAEGLDIPERAGMSRLEVIVCALADRPCLLVIDNCEHLIDAVRDAVVALLGACPPLRVLATSRTRLMLAEEHVFAVPGLSLDGEGRGDAVDLFVARMVSGGGMPPRDPEEVALIASLCRALDGMALAIELAAARAPSFGLDGLHRALSASHAFLAMRRPGDDRHRSLRAAIDWSYDLADEPMQTALRACTVFATRFDLDAAAAMTGMGATELVEVLGRLVDGNLMTLLPGSPNRYRMLETIRQYGVERATELGEFDTLRRRHLHWCQAMLAELVDETTSDPGWAERVDRVLDDARAALGFASEGPALRADAAFLAASLGAVTFARGRAGESQQRYRQAASLAEDGSGRHDWLYHAARVGLARYSGDEAVGLLEEASEVALASSDPERAALDIAHSATVQHRHVGTMGRPISTVETDALLERAARLGAGSAIVGAAVAVASVSRMDVVPSRQAREHALALARVSGDALLIDAALDQLCAADLAVGDLEAAAAVVSARLESLATVPITPITAMDHSDAYLMAAHVALSVGRCPQARRAADAFAALPYLREERHVALARRLEVDGLAGASDETLSLAEVFETSWARAGRPVTNTLGTPALAMATVHGIRGDDAERERWLTITKAMLRDPSDLADAALLWPAVYTGIYHLDRGDARAALASMPCHPLAVPDRSPWSQALWLPWYAALWAEASVLAGVDDADRRLVAAAQAAGPNAVARAIIARTRAVRDEDRSAVAGFVEPFEAAGCAYQAQRTRALARLVGLVRPAVPAVPAVPADPTRGAALPPGNPLRVLSRRELEVVRLVATGATNPDIATTLYISRKTVEHHVSNILTKLGVATRTEVAALAVRLGAVDD